MIAVRVWLVAILFSFSLVVHPAMAGERYAVIITGAAGGEVYAKKYQKWRLVFVSMLRDKFSYQQDHLFVLSGEGAGGDQEPGAGPGSPARVPQRDGVVVGSPAKQDRGVGAPGVIKDESDRALKATRENVQRVLRDLRKRMTKDDQLLVLLIGHGTSYDGPNGDDAKFNLVGPDLSASEWADLLEPIPGRLVFVNTTSASFPFLRKLASRGRVVLTATDSAAQQFETIFPEYFLRAFDDSAADLDKNGRISIWEAFTYASSAVRQAFEQKGQLPTERPLLDDTGAGIGREAQNPGTDGAVARVTYLEPEAPLELPSDSALAALVKRRADLESAFEELKARKESMPPDQYEAELEKIVTEIARISQQIKTKS